MDTQNKNLVSYLMNSTSRSSASGFQPGGKEPGAPGFDAFIQNDSRTARNDFHTGNTGNRAPTFDHSDSRTRKQEFTSSRETEARQKPGVTETRQHRSSQFNESRRTTTEHQPVSQKDTDRGAFSNAPFQSQSHTPAYHADHSGNETKGPQFDLQNRGTQAATLQALMALLQNGEGLQGNPVLAGLTATDLTALNGEQLPPGLDALMQRLNELKANPDLALMNLVQGPNGNASKDMLIEQLRDMDLDPDVLDSLIDALNGDDAEGGQRGSFLQALQGLLQALQSVQSENAEDGVTLQTAQANNAGASVLEKKVIDALMKAGLTETEAQKIIDQARGTGGDDSKVDGRVVLAQLAQSLSKTKGAGQPVAESQTEPATPSREPKITLDTQATDPNRKSVNELVGDKSDSRTASNLTHEGKAQTPNPVQPAATAAVNPKPAMTTAQTGSAPNPTVQNVSTGGEGTSTTPGSHPVGASSEKAGTGFKPMLAETYSARGGVEKPVATQIIEKVTFRNFGNHREVHVKLDPPSLGTVRLNVSSSGETVRATLVAENHAAKQAIENSLAQLKDSMHSQGMKVDTFTVLVGGNNQGQSPHQRQEGVHAFRPFETADNIESHETGEETSFTQPRFFSESQTISLFA